MQPMDTKTMHTRYADLSGALNSTDSSPGILVEQNSTADVNQSKTKKSLRT